jgi:CRP-like cAMP-binding protein
VLQGEPGDKFYVIQSGTFDFFVDKVGWQAGRQAGWLAG